MDLEAKLKRWWEKVVEAKDRLSRGEGERESILRRLEEEDGLSSVEEAEKYVERQGREKDELSGKLDKVLLTLKEDFGFE